MITNVADRQDVVDAARQRGLDISVVSVTDREMKFSLYRPAVDARELESMVLGESAFGQMALAQEEEPALFEQVLQIISHGSFPNPGGRDSLTRSQRRQLRDAMILMAHVRCGVTSLSPMTSEHTSTTGAGSG